MPSPSQKDLEEMGALGSSPSHLPSWFLARRPLPSHPNTRHFLGIHVTLTEETGAVPPLPHTRTAPLVEDMLSYARTGLTETIVMAWVGYPFLTGDSHWERTWVWVRPGMPHFTHGSGHLGWKTSLSCC